MDRKINTSSNQRQCEHTKKGKCNGKRLFKVSRTGDFVGHLFGCMLRARLFPHVKTYIDILSLLGGQILVIERQRWSTCGIKICDMCRDLVGNGGERSEKLDITSALKDVSDNGSLIIKRLTLQPQGE